MKYYSEDNAKNNIEGSKIIVKLLKEIDEKLNNTDSSWENHTDWRDHTDVS